MCFFKSELKTNTQDEILNSFAVDTVDTSTSAPSVLEFSSPNGADDLVLTPSKGEITNVKISTFSKSSAPVIHETQTSSQFIRCHV